MAVGYSTRRSASSLRFACGFFLGIVCTVFVFSSYRNGSGIPLRQINLSAKKQHLPLKSSNSSSNNSPEYSPWPWPGSNPAHPNECEEAWGQGFLSIKKIIGNPPEGRLGSQETRSLPITKVKWGPSQGGTSGWMRCLFNSRLRTSICEGHNLIINPDFVKVCQGGEELASVMGRHEKEEMPELAPGALQVLAGPEDATWQLPEASATELYPEEANTGPGLRFWGEALVNLRTVPNATCGTVFEQPMLVVVRYEYVNVYHSNTDWHMAFLAEKVLGLGTSGPKPGVIFMDGHAKGNLDPIWSSLFSSVHFLKHLHGPICLRHVALVPVGYASPIFQTHKERLGIPCTAQAPPTHPIVVRSPRATSRSLEYSDWFLERLGVSRGQPSIASLFRNPPERSEKRVLRVLFVRREHFVAHPRNKEGPVSRMEGEDETYLALCDWAAKRSGMTCHEMEKLESEVAGKDPSSGNSPVGRVLLTNGWLTRWPIQRQVAAAYWTDVWVGAHGAGLTFLQFMRPGSHVVEINNQDTQYQYMARTRGLVHSSVQESSHWVVDRVEKIVLELLK